MSCSGPQSSAGSPAITNDVVDSPAAQADPAAVGLATPQTPSPRTAPAREHGGREGPEPTRFGDWEKAGRCIDF
jgi:hypothetical protein